MKEIECDGLRLDDSDGIQNTLEINLLNVPGVLGDQEFLKALKDYRNSDDIFDTDFVEGYVESKWQEYGKTNFMVEFYFYMFAFIVYAIDGTVLFPKKIKLVE